MWPLDYTSIFNYKILAGSLQEEFVLHYINIRNTSQTVHLCAIKQKQK